MTIDLNGTWQLQPDWQSPGPALLPSTLFARDTWLPAQVPGTVHTDLLRAKRIPDPFYGDNETRVQWVAEMGWCYRRTFEVPPDFLQHEAIHLIAEGLDTFATIFLNRQRVAATENMFIAHRFDVKPWLRAGENEIEIRFDSPLARAQELETRFGKLPVALESPRVYVRKAQYSFSWDWGPKLPTSGIWRPIRLEAHQHGRIVDLAVDIQLSDDLQHAHVSVKADLERNPAHEIDCHVEITGPNFHAQQNLSSCGEKVACIFDLERPQLWWPNGYGEQPLYFARVTLRTGHEEIAVHGIRFGVRKLELRREPDSGGESFVFVINGTPVFCKGANWIPADSFVPRLTLEQYRTLLTRARAAHMNMLRVWGGGIYEDPRFYDLCDELGLMIWQDFMFACGGYPEQAEFAQNVRHEVAAVVKQLRSHPALVLWCGNNENEWLWHMERQRAYHEMPGFTVFQRIIPEICATLDPSRPYWQSSPFGGDDPNAEKQGDRHQWNIWSNWADPATVSKDRGRFLSEFGFQAPASLHTWKKYLAEPERTPQSPVFEHHNKQTEGPERLFRFLAGQMHMPVSFEDFVYKTQIVQAEALKTMVEHWRREKFHTAGALFWQLNDCWPVSSWSVIDSEMQPKAAYWYACRFFAPLLVSVKTHGKDSELWVTNDTRGSREAELAFEMLGWKGEKIFARRERVLIPGNAALRLAAPAWEELVRFDPQQHYVRVRLFENGETVTENRLFFCRFKHLVWPQPRLEFRLEHLAADSWRLQVNSDCFVKSLALLEPPPGVELSDNFFDLEAGEEKSILMRTPPGGQSVALQDLHWKWLA